MILLLLKGFFIGLFMLIPGVSGGSIAILFNEYDKMVYHTSNLFKEFKKSFFYLLILAIGGILGLYCSSIFLHFFIENYYLELIYFFFGIIVLFVINFINKNNEKKISIKYILYILIGILISILIGFIPKDLFNVNNIFGLLILGLMLAIALILPGISVSYILLIFSCYDTFILALKNMDIFYLFKIGIFLMFGIFVTIKLLDYLMNKYKSITNFTIIGFMIGSLLTFIPIPITVNEFNIAMIFFMQGILIFLLFGKIVKR